PDVPHARAQEPEQVLRVLAYAEHALALEQHEVRGAERVEADEGRRLAREPREVPPAPRAHTLHERLLRAREEEDHADVARGFGHQPAGEREERRHAGGVVVGGRYDLAPADVRHRRGVAGADRRPGQAEPADAEEGAERDRQRSRKRPPHRGRRRVHAAADAVGEGRQHAAGRVGVEHEAGVGGVVVGDENHGARSGGIAELRRHVGRGPLRQQEPAQEPRARRDVVGRSRGPGRPEGDAEGAAAQAGDGRGAARQTDRPPVRAVGGLDLAHGLESQALQLVGDQLRGLALALAAGAAPDLGRSLHTTLLQLVWVILAYMIASTVLVLTAGRLSDLFGRKRAYLLGFAIFAATSLGAGFAADGTELILWRIAQGIGGAL